MSRTDSIAMWKYLRTRGTADEGPQPSCDGLNPEEWIRVVAQRVLEADSEPDPNRRVAALVGAVGLTGAEDKYARLRQLIEMLSWFPKIDVDGDEIPQTQGQTIACILQAAQAQKILTGSYSYDDKKAKDLIRSLLPKKV